MKIDWCFNTASIGLKEERKLAFAYIFIQYARLSYKENFMTWSHPKESTLVINVKPEFIEDFDIDFYQAKKWQSKYWTFLKPILQKSFMENSNLVTDNYKFSIKKGEGLTILAKIKN